jgi:hypothetical protein
MKKNYKVKGVTNVVNIPPHSPKAERSNKNYQKGTKIDYIHLALRQKLLKAIITGGTIDTLNPKLYNFAIDFLKLGNDLIYSLFWGWNCITPQKFVKIYPNTSIYNKIFADEIILSDDKYLIIRKNV